MEGIHEGFPVGGAAHFCIMGAADDVGIGQQGIASFWIGFVFFPPYVHGHMEAGIVFYFVQQGFPVNELGPGHVYQQAVLFHEGKDVSADEAFRFFGEGQGQHQYVRFLHRFFQLIHGVGFIKKRGLGQVAGNGGEAAVERGKHFCHGLSNAAEACNEHSLFGKKFLMVAQDMEFPLLQVLELFPEAAVQGNDHAAGGLCNTPGPAAGVAVQVDILRQFFEIQVVHAGSGGLHHGWFGKKGDFLFPDIAHNISGKHHICLFQGFFPLLFIQLFQPEQGGIGEEGADIFFIGFFDGRGNDKVHSFSPLFTGILWMEQADAERKEGRAVLPLEGPGPFLFSCAAIEGKESFRFSLL